MDRNSIKIRLTFWYSILWIFILTALWQSYAIYFPNTTTTKSKWVGLFAGAVAILAASCKINEIILFKYKDSSITDFIKTIVKYSNVFAVKKYLAIIWFLVIAFIFLFNFLGFPFLSCFIAGMASCILANKISDTIVPNGIIKLIKSLDFHPNTLYKLITNVSSVVILFNAGISLCLIVIFFHIYKDYQILNGFLLGYVFIALINTISGMVSKKAVNEANEVLESVEYNLTSSNNPLEALKQFIKCTENITLLNMDFGLTYVCALIASMTVGAETMNLQGAFFPIIIATNGLFAMIISLVLVRFNKIKPLKKLYITELLTMLILCSFSIYCTKIWFPEFMGLFYPIGLGAIAGLIIGFINYNHTNLNSKCVKSVANSSVRGFYSLLFQTIKESFLGILTPSFMAAIIIVLSFLVSEGIKAPMLGVWGITLCILSMTSVMGVIYTAGIFSQMLENGFDKGINDYSYDLKDTVYYKINDIKSKTGIICKNNSNVTSLLCCISVLIAYSVVAQLEEIDILNPYVITAMLIGISTPFLFSSSVIDGISKTAKNLVFDVKAQFKKYPQILRNEMVPDFNKCISIASKSSAGRAVMAIIPVLAVFFLTGLILKTEAVAGLILSSLLSTFCILIFLNNADIISDSSKRNLERNIVNIEKSDEYAYIIESNCIFSNLKEVIIPIFNILIKFLAILALTLAPLFM